MALELCSESSGWAFSPRISFSNDLSNNESSSSTIHREDISLLDPSSSSSDFDFCILQKNEQESSSADELFSNGQILPLEIKKIKTKSPSFPKPETAHDQESLKQIMEAQEIENKEQEREEEHQEHEELEEEEGEEEKRIPKSFWRFNKSNSLNCVHGSKSSLMCSLSGLRRSSSTGSDPNPNQKRAPSKENRTSNKPNPFSSYSNPKPCSGIPKSQPLKNEAGRSTAMKSHYSSYNNGVRISPVLNVPTPYIPKGTSNLFNLGSLLGKKEKNKRNPYSSQP